MAKRKSVFVCSSCGKESSQWVGKCTACGAWNSYYEQAVTQVSSATRSAALQSEPEKLSNIKITQEDRIDVQIPEFNRVLGGGIVPGELVLIGGEPGIGKSTLLLQTSAKIAASGVVAYASGEETTRQVKLRAQRLGINSDNLYLLSETNLDNILQHFDRMQPEVAIVDSIQSVYLPDFDASAGSITQVRECTQKLMYWSKVNQTPVFITGHVTKEGAIAGPRVLEHIVDCVLYFEGEQFSSYRLLRSVKNRFGSTNEVGIFEMHQEGLREVENPSKIFLSQRQEETVGSAVTATLEGSRPLLVVVQALTSQTSFGLPRRTANGADYGRLLMIIAVLMRRAGYHLSNQDIIVNVTGGLKLDEPASDLAIAAAIASSLRDIEVDPLTLMIGEIGLSGELRSVPQIERRIDEAVRLGFKKCIVPRTAMNTLKNKDIQVIGARNIREALHFALGIKDDKKHEEEEE
jgi:DNA repair protein RadA/Sms